jgi:hypothetical protein
MDLKTSTAQSICDENYTARQIITRDRVARNTALADKKSSAYKVTEFPCANSALTKRRYTKKQKPTFKKI